MSTDFPGSPRTMSFVAFSCTIGNWLGNPCISHMMQYTVGWKSSGGKITHAMGKKFPGSPNTKGFVAFSLTMRNWWGNQWTSPMMCTIGWESNGRKGPILWKKNEYQFPRLSPYQGFCYTFPYCRKFMGKCIHFPYAEVYHRNGIGQEKSAYAMKKVWLSISQPFPIPWVLLHFLIKCKIYGETHAFAICWSIPKMGM